MRRTFLRFDLNNIQLTEELPFCLGKVTKETEMFLFYEQNIQDASKSL